MAPLVTVHDPLTALHQVLCRLEEHIVGVGVDQDEFFGNHPLPLGEFIRNMDLLQPGGSFLDLGSGTGTKLLLARYLGWSQITGVEHDSELARISRLLVPEAQIVEEDAFRFDCAGFDVIYTYRLCRDLGRQEELGWHIAETADSGTMVFYAGADMPVGEHVAESVWVV